MKRLELPERWEKRPELRRHIGELILAGRRRTAMDEILQLLRHDAESTELLYLALMLNQGRTAQLQSPEPLTEQQIRSALLAPIAAECSDCRNFWYADHLLLSSYGYQREGLKRFDPVGTQCQICRYTLCRDCRTRRKPRSQTQDVDKVEIAEQHCPAYECPGVLTHPVLPTGRHDVMSTSPDSIEHVIVSRDGIIPPTIDEALTIVTRVLPLISDDAPRIHIRRSGPGLMGDDSGRDELALSHIREMERDGLLELSARTRYTWMFMPTGRANDDNYLITVVTNQALSGSRTGHPVR